MNRFSFEKGTIKGLKRGERCPKVLVVPIYIDGIRVTKIGQFAFDGCRSLASIILPEGLTEIGSVAFATCTGLKSITLPNSLTKIGGGAFLFCYSLASITLPEGLTEIGNSAFGECAKLPEETKRRIMELSDDAL